MYMYLNYLNFLETLPFDVFIFNLFVQNADFLKICQVARDGQILLTIFSRTLIFYRFLKTVQGNHFLRFLMSKVDSTYKFQLKTMHIVFLLLTKLT